MESTIRTIAARLGDKGWRLATAESCTGGLIGHALTNVPGSSDWYQGGVVAYANAVKRDVLGVPETVLESAGAVSRETVEAMARGVAGLLGVQAAVAVSGIAGPTGGTPDKPVGTVWLAWLVGGAVDCEVRRFSGTRRAVKEQTLRAALEGLAKRLS